MNSGAYIPSLDAKDIYTSNHFNSGLGGGYQLKRQDGNWNLKKFINQFDYQLDSIFLEQIDPNLCFIENGKRYQQKIINVTFKYAYKLYNNIRKDVYVLNGYNYAKLQFVDGVCVIDGQLVGIQTNVPIVNPCDEDLLKPYFAHRNDCYVKVKEPPVLQNRSQLRELLYRDGFWANGRHYVRMKRSAGSARTGRCLFCDEALYQDLKDWQFCGIDVKENDPIDLAALEQYISLQAQSIIGTIRIPLDQILIINDYDSEFEEECVNVYEDNGHLAAKREKVKIANSIWDGQQLADEQLFPPGTNWGMMLLRNKFFKSCCFNTNVQKWFWDNGITDISQLKGFTLAKSIDDVKLITTPNSIKYAKFGSLEKWLKTVPDVFGVVKHDKKTHYFDGHAVQCHYQLLGTLQLSEKEMAEFLKPQFEFAQALKSDPAVVRYFIKYPEDKTYSPVPMLTANDVVYSMMQVTDRFTKTKYYQDFTIDMMRAYYSNLKCGHVMINGNYQTIVSCPIEMLKAQIGQFDGSSHIGVGHIHSTRFGYDQYILGSRSPHVAAGNTLVTYNVDDEMLNEYMNLTPEIVVINSINENILNRLSGSDEDGDTMLLTDNQILLQAAMKNYDKFAVPVCSVQAKKIKRFYNAAQQADLDIKTGCNSIGQIVNVSQTLNNLYWDRINNGETHEENEELYNDIAILDVMSGLEISISVSPVR